MYSFSNLEILPNVWFIFPAIFFLFPSDDGFLKCSVCGDLDRVTMNNS